MKKKIITFVLIGGVAGALCGGTAKLTVDLDKPGAKVSPELYGIFFEEINRGGDGGLYAELIQNRSFEDAPGILLGWTPLDGGASRVALDKSQPLNANNPTCLRLEIVNPNDGRGGV
ncbi:MAG: alpha-N-arabinofuranosidase, partial [Deltaproteobacteria bacterium]